MRVIFCEASFLGLKIKLGLLWLCGSLRDSINPALTVPFAARLFAGTLWTDSGYGSDFTFLVSKESGVNKA